MGPLSVGFCPVVLFQVHLVEEVVGFSRAGFPVERPCDVVAGRFYYPQTVLFVNERLSYVRVVRDSVTWII